MNHKVTDNVLFANRLERRLISVVFLGLSLMWLLGSVSAVRVSEVDDGIFFGVMAVFFFSAVVRAQLALSISRRGDTILVRGPHWTRKFSLHEHLEWQVRDSLVGVFTRAVLFVDLPDGRSLDLGRYGIWTLRRGRQRAELEAVAAQLSAWN